MRPVDLCGILSVYMAKKKPSKASILQSNLDALDDFIERYMQLRFAQEMSDEEVELDMSEPLRVLVETTVARWGTEE
jgi:hypothetical protein